jgi:WhiB family transcriptional regulator, redox-sensing transcriptional regulator
VVAIPDVDTHRDARPHTDPELYIALMIGVDCLELADLLHPPAWFADALCKEHLELVFVPSAGPVADDARALCRSCLVRVECLGYALMRPELLGCWGGTTAADRDRARAEEVDVEAVLARLDRPTPRAVWTTAPCAGCGGLLSRKDLAEGDGFCWACRPAA